MASQFLYNVLCCNNIILVDKNLFRNWWHVHVYSLFETDTIKVTCTIFVYINNYRCNNSNYNCNYRSAIQPLMAQVSNSDWKTDKAFWSQVTLIFKKKETKICQLVDSRVWYWNVFDLCLCIFLSFDDWNKINCQVIDKVSYATNVLTTRAP